ncbi:deoxyribose-phosphate aldolase [Flavobacterium columnare NBRC 100251 = ATCC 23463]|uniref:Deoxyribose-phosphate aldolase n=2 Tax=Flavobacterium columnare TaxID=996 RepID=G8X5N2_FLACA|nr:deoxyribose-phosphate aldolase [Flavobacterium columnare]AEW86876.1 deoxyribose-phosphate aldolase [Flavobacterium columnare ATCC 49512]AMO20787.1 deoxyribose-phosphate aldolase [Flavobacterium columnare]ANO47303.1 deoxyribose-phosphate aldolase [Flavobacterium columnare]APT22034.1 deoxyribose-phosphate aldolase [Flavobacterium columnare]AUX18773.1 2-deoxyribose-5-phosphate aldolase [Flavobacterium columnare]
MDVREYLDSTYLKKAEQAGLTNEENTKKVIETIQEAIKERFKLVMIRPEYVSTARKMIDEQNSELLVGTVIDFPFGTDSVDSKIKEATEAIQNGVDELDYVINYEAFKKGEIELIKEETIQCTQLGLSNNKVVKFIIEVAALTDDHIIQISSLIRNTVVANFSESECSKVFVKSSTGFYPTTDGKPNGATIHTIKLMLENSSPLPVKAAGGVRNIKEANDMIELGVKRIGTSAAKTIVEGLSATGVY